MILGLLIVLIVWKKREGFQRSIRRLISVKSDKREEGEDVSIDAQSEVPNETVREGARHRTALVLPGTARIGASGIDTGSGVVMRN